MAKKEKATETENAKKSRIPKNKRFYWAFYLLSLISLVLGVALLPVWEKTDVVWKDLGTNLISMILFFIIIVYIVGYLIKQIIREKKITIKILTVFEAGFFFAIAIGCIMEQFNMVSVVGPCTIVGAAIWSRGFVYIVKAYLCKHEKTDKYPLWMLVFSVGLVTLGTIMMTKEIFTTRHIVWFSAGLLIVAALVFFVFGVISKPKVDKALQREQKKIKKAEKEQKALEAEQKKLEKEKKALEKQEKKTEKAKAKNEKTLEEIEAEKKDAPALLEAKKEEKK
jgi:signal transduction histidine kinase